MATTTAVAGYTTTLKNGTEYTFECPFTLADMQSADPDGLSSVMKTLETSCNASSWTNDACDTCWSAMLNQGMKVAEAIMANETLMAEIKADAMVDASLVPQIDFKKGCPWEKACGEMIKSTAEIPGVEGLISGMVEFLDSCIGAPAGIDFPKTLQSLVPMLDNLGVPTAGFVKYTEGNASSTPVAAKPSASPLAKSAGEVATVALSLLLASSSTLLL